MEINGFCSRWDSRISKIRCLCSQKQDSKHKLFTMQYKYKQKCCTISFLVRLIKHFELLRIDRIVSLACTKVNY